MRKRIIHLLTFRFTHSLTHLRASSLNKAKKLKLKQAQSTIEYCTMVALVMVGIVVLGPYVIRSVNAHFKMWEDTTEDAFLDPLSDRDPTGLPTPQCRCPFKPIGCGLGGCKKTEMYWDKDCVPLDCELPEPKCEVENSCCEEEPGPCGVGCPPPGEQQVKITCGNLPPRFECRSTLFCNQCTGFIPDNSTSCPGDDVGVVGQVPWVPVDDCSPPAGRKCEAECLPGYVVQAGACVPPVCGQYTIQTGGGAGGGGCSPSATSYNSPQPWSNKCDSSAPCCVIRCALGEQRIDVKAWCVGKCKNWEGGPVDADGCYAWEGNNNKGAPKCEITCAKPCP